MRATRYKAMECTSYSVIILLNVLHYSYTSGSCEQNKLLKNFLNSTFGYDLTNNSGEDIVPQTLYSITHSDRSHTACNSDSTYVTRT